VRKSKPFTIAFNMLTCATLFCWAGPCPRETISGLFGRKKWMAAGRFWVLGARLIDAMHPNEPHHCKETFECETAMRQALRYTL
jgi:hypothetical protein